MLFDDRWGASPAWASGWTNTGWNFTVWESAGSPALPFSVFVKSAQSGSIDLPMIDGTVGYNYVIIVD